MKIGRILKKLKYRGLVLTISLSVSACSGGGSTSGVPVPPAVPSFPGGIWHGTMHLDKFGTTDSITGVISEDGRAIFRRSPTFDFIVLGTSFNTNVIAMHRLGFLFLTGNSAEAGSISGLINERDSLDAQFDIPGWSSGTIGAVYDVDLYERPSSMAKIGGTWGGGSKVITIDSMGILFGQDTNGCTLDGTVSLINPTYNAYDLVVNLGCGNPHEYTGLAYLTDLNPGSSSGVPDGTINLLLTSGVWEYSLSFNRP